MKVWSRLVILGVVLSMLAGCMRDDDEPIRPTRPISRLYISTSQFTNSPNVPRVDNVYLVEAADQTAFNQWTPYRTNAPGGSAILYSPHAQLLFQSAQENNVPASNDIQIYQVDTLRGSLASRGEPRSELFTSVRGFAYHPGRDLLFMPNSAAAPTTIPPSLVGSRLWTGAPTQSDLYVYDRPNAKGNASRPNYRIPFPDKVIRSVFIHDIDIRPASLDNTTYLSTFTTSDTEILGFKDLPDGLVGGDSLRTVDPTFTLTLTGIPQVTGMAYSPTLDLMVATHLVSEDEGRILFYEDFSTHTASTSINPDRIIAGNATMLRSPSGVAIDTREGAQYFYVADSRTGANNIGAVLRFLITDEGDVQPNEVLQIPGRTPVGVSLDARGTIAEPGGEGATNNSARIRRR